MSERILAGETPAEALESLLRRGAPGLRGLGNLRRQVRQRLGETRRRGRLDGTLDRVRELLDRALEAERQALFPDPSDAARLAEAELDALPTETARAVRALADYQWRSPEAAEAYQEIRDLLRREVLDSQFRGLKEALRSPHDLERLRDMLADLNTMLEADARGEDTTAAFEGFMQRYGDFFPERPATLGELIDGLARRAAAAGRLLASLDPEQRAELAGLLAETLGDLGLEHELARLGQALRGLRPDLDWTGSARMSGETPLGLGDATTALEELADLESLDATLAQNYPGATLDDIDLDALRRTLGAQAVADAQTLRRIERELAERGFVTHRDGEMQLSPKAIRRIGAKALRDVFSDLESRGRGEHDVAAAGRAGEPTGASRPWAFGDEQPLDVGRTVRNAVLRRPPGPGPVALDVADFEVAETERRTSAAVCLLVDLSYSMALRGTWGAAKTTALALHSLVTTRYPQDAITIIGFSDYARELRLTELAAHSIYMVQGTNLQHGLALAGRHLARRPEAEPVVLVITDGEPTAHLDQTGTSWFHWPPLPETLELTLAEAYRLTRLGTTINVFMLDDDPRLVQFVHALARLNGGRVFSPSAERLGAYVVRDYLRARRGR